jgi:hypothetical protein
MRGKTAILVGKLSLPSEVTSGSEKEEKLKKCTHWMLPGLLLVFGLIVEAKSTYAAAGSLDPTFGKGGVTITTSTSGFIVAYALKLQSNGKILVLVQAGDERTEVLRYTSIGALDATFGSKGISVLPTTFSPVFGSMAIQSNGQIVVGGEGLGAGYRCGRIRVGAP